MRRTLTLVALVLAACGLAAQPPTKITLAQIAIPAAATGTPQVLVYVSVPGGTAGTFVFAKLDASLTLDTSGALPVLKAAPAAAVEQVDTYNGADGNIASFNLTKPGHNLKVFRNGLLMALGADYTYTPGATMICFVPGDIPQPGDSVVLIYTAP